MLKHLYIKNYALIRELEIDFDGGMSVLTGETGAGKSIILGALNLVMGGKADNSVITEGEERCVIEAVFTEAGNEIVVRRELSATGRSRSFVNDEVASQTELRQLAARMIDIHSQHESLMLSDDSFQRTVVDAIAHNDHAREDYAAAYHDWTVSRDTLREMEAIMVKIKKDADYVAFQYNELQAAQLDDADLDELEAEQYRLSHAEEIGRQLSYAVAALDGDEQSVIQLLSDCRLQEADSALDERLQSVIIELRDIAREAEHALDRTEVNPQRLIQVETRIDTLNRLLHKHEKQTVDELIDLREKLAEAVAMVDNSDARIEQARRELTLHAKTVAEKAEALTKTRQAVALPMAQTLENDLRDLGIQHPKIEVAITPTAEPTESGQDHIEMRFAANLGQTPRAIGSVASGGEISRVMLAVKAMIASTNGLPTIIFDEIDTGVSGNTATRMGEIMHRIAETRQVIAITHNPQIAVQADHQFGVYKQDNATYTETHIRKMSNEQRKNYIEQVYATISRAAASKDAE